MHPPRASLAAACAMTSLALLAPLAPGSWAEGSDYAIPLYGAFDHAPITYRVIAPPSRGSAANAAAGASSTTPDARVIEVVHMALGAWEDAAHAYAQHHAEARHLTALRLAPAPAGAVPDITIHLVVTGGPVAGESTPAGAYVGDGNNRHSDVFLPMVYLGTCEGENCAGIPGSGLGSMSAQSFYRLAAHELGHALGLYHSNDGRSIMRTSGLLQKAGGTQVGTFCFGEIELAALAYDYGYLASANRAFTAPPTLEYDMPAGMGAQGECVAPRAAPEAPVLPPAD